MPRLHRLTGCLVVAIAAAGACADDEPSGFERVRPVDSAAYTDAVDRAPIGPAADAVVDVGTDASRPADVLDSLDAAVDSSAGEAAVEAAVVAPRDVVDVAADRGGDTGVDATAAVVDASQPNIVTPPPRCPLALDAGTDPSLGSGCGNPIPIDLSDGCPRMYRGNTCVGGSLYTSCGGGPGSVLTVTASRVTGYVAFVTAGFTIAAIPASPICGGPGACFGPTANSIAAPDITRYLAVVSSADAGCGPFTLRFETQ